MSKPYSTVAQHEAPETTFYINVKGGSLDDLDLDYATALKISQALDWAYEVGLNDGHRLALDEEQKHRGPG